jgi:hypothetical protein
MRSLIDFSEYRWIIDPPSNAPPNGGDVIYRFSLAAVFYAIGIAGAALWV